MSDIILKNLTLLAQASNIRDRAAALTRHPLGLIIVKEADFCLKLFILLRLVQRRQEEGDWVAPANCVFSFLIKILEIII